MAKIIEKGKGVDWISKEITCKSCGTIYQLEAEDILSADRDHYDSTTGKYDCPGCGTYRTCSLPRHIQEYVEKRNLERYEERKKTEVKKIYFSHILAYERQPFSLKIICHPIF